MIEFIRVSEGTGTVLGLWNRKLLVPPTTGYLMTYYPGRCSANCKFCAQARESRANIDKLSRVSWPKCKFNSFLRSFKKNQEKLKRICVQTINRPKVIDDLCEIVNAVKEASDLPVSVCCQPVGQEDIQRLFDAGANRIGIPLDAATPHLFDSIKGKSAGGPYRWENHLQALKKARSIFGGGVTTHLIIGLGESEREAAKLIQLLHYWNITIGLFAFTPISGTFLANKSRPPVDSYRRVQLSRHLIVNDLTDYSEMKFENGKISDWGTDRSDISSALNSGEPFQTSGCPDCNRPFYNESPLGPIYNYPRKLSSKEKEKVRSELNLI